ncbi:uncharacterized protein LOC111271892 isoform X1 [Varroa jacobsoni]|uniref:uncharacterized protein LOC111271892 isoform X1 n=1 Tax=Varroa jacobsoni TaxID=62625 RepID=UPI000BF48204|nr:uncharacterized protein LOC111271892 isoform X1 [Varroa jacobsoni]XP_022708663.1 uncharacterized protein LOC111271892 isoform X1 [Varroa jacobsoni]XP_022708664.1 uncharacterized protein LOC111271892 isoform X1 [Varroa jacobsoni]
MDAATAWEKIEQVLSNTRPNQRTDILFGLRNWLESCGEERPDTAVNQKVASQLDIIADFIRKKLPLEAILPSERIVAPTSGENADCNPRTTMHVDAFLYPDEEINKLCEDGILSMSYCSDCGSRNIRPLTIISHSASKSRTQFIFQKVLPPDLVNGGTVVDVGSRLGVLCYGAYLMSGASRIIGVELNSDLCTLQESVIQRFSMNDRIQIVNADIVSLPDVLAGANAVFINNSFEFFSDHSKQREIWAFIARSCKPGCILVTVPSLEDAFKSLQISPTLVDLTKWVRKMPIALSFMDESDDEFAEMKEVHRYEVLNPMK